MVNKLPFPLLVSQFNSQQKALVLPPDKRICYNFENATKHGEKKVVIGEVEKKVSQPFFVEDIDDFQLPYKAEIGGGEKQTKEWHEPGEHNGYYRCVRITVTSKDDATIFVFFQTPSMRY